MTLTQQQADWLERNQGWVTTKDGIPYQEIGAVSPDGRFMKIKMRHPILFRREIDWVGVGRPLRSLTEDQ